MNARGLVGLLSIPVLVGGVSFAAATVAQDKDETVIPPGVCAEDSTDADNEEIAAYIALSGEAKRQRAIDLVAEQDVDPSDLPVTYREVRFESRDASLATLVGEASVIVVGTVAELRFSADSPTVAMLSVGEAIKGDVGEGSDLQVHVPIDLTYSPWLVAECRLQIVVQDWFFPLRSGVRVIAILGPDSELGEATLLPAGDGGIHPITEDGVESRLEALRGLSEHEAVDAIRRVINTGQ